MAKESLAKLKGMSVWSALKYLAIVLVTGKNSDNTTYELPISGEITLDPTNLALDETVLATNTAIGPTDATAANADTGTFSLNALVKRLLAKIPSLGAAATAAAIPVSIATDNTPKVLDAGPSTAHTRTRTNSADMQAVADVSAAPTVGQKLVVCGLVISVGATAQTVTLKEETSGTVLAGPYYIPINGSLVIRPSGTRLFKTATADKKVQGQASAAGNLTIETWAFSEA